MLDSTSTTPPTAVTVDAEAGNGSSETGDEVEGSTVTPDSNSNPPSYKSFSPRSTDHSHLPHNTHSPHSVSFPFRDFNSAPPKCVITSSEIEVQPHDVIALSDMSSRAYPPGSAVAPVVPANHSSNHLKVQQLNGKTGLNHDGNGSNELACRSASPYDISDDMKNGSNSTHSVPATALSDHLQPVDENISHVTVTVDGDARAAATLPLESTDLESAPSINSYFSWLFWIISPSHFFFLFFVPKSC
jgi:hypothetical protein